MIHKMKVLTMKQLIRSIIALARKCSTLEELIHELYFILGEKEETTTPRKAK